MSRYTKSNNRKARAYKFSILENNKEFLKGKKRTYAPGQHGPTKRTKLSNYGIHLVEKQKLKYLYGLSEKQLKNTFAKAKKKSGILGENFLFLLESRIDNLVYRVGFATTRRQSRQLVNHGHVLVNGKKIDIPSYIASVGDVITIRDKSKGNTFILESLKVAKRKSFIKYDENSMTGTYFKLPTRDELTGQVNESLVVEYYNK